MKFHLIVDREKPEEVVATVHAPNSLTEKIEALVREYSGQDAVAAYNDDELRMIPYASIDCFTVIDGKTWAIDSKARRYRIRQRLYELEEVVPSSFFHINKSTLANESCIQHFTSTYSGGVNAIFKSGYEDYVSRRCFAVIKRRFQVK